MNIEETKEAIRVMQAFVDGNDLEVFGPVGKWEPLYFPRWGWDDTKYRIKPTATLRPWTADEVPLGAWMRFKRNPQDRILLGWVSVQSDRDLWLEEFARTIENDFDHDEDAHRYGTTCRVCDAEDLLKETKAKEAKL